jgi:hypothetical protein
MQGRFNMEYRYRLFTIVRYNYRDYNAFSSRSVVLVLFTLYILFTHWYYWLLVLIQTLS